MRDVWLILCAAAAMLTAVPALKRLDAAISERLKREAAEDDRAAESADTPETDQKER